MAREVTDIGAGGCDGSPGLFFQNNRQLPSVVQMVLQIEVIAQK
jgi:hypothetical protein